MPPRAYSSNPKAKKTALSSRPRTARRVYTIETIIGKRTHKGVEQYQVKWAGYVQATWEPPSNISDEFITAYEDSLKKKKKSPAKKAKKGGKKKAKDSGDDDDDDEESGSDDDNKNSGVSPSAQLESAAKRTLGRELKVTDTARSVASAVAANHHNTIYSRQAFASEDDDCSDDDDVKADETRDWQTAPCMRLYCTTDQYLAATPSLSITSKHIAEAKMSAHHGYGGDYGDDIFHQQYDREAPMNWYDVFISEIVNKRLRQAGVEYLASVTFLMPPLDQAARDRIAAQTTRRGRAHTLQYESLKTRSTLYIWLSVELCRGMNGSLVDQYEWRSTCNASLQHHHAYGSIGRRQQGHDGAETFPVATLLATGSDTLKAALATDAARTALINTAFDAIKPKITKETIEPSFLGRALSTLISLSYVTIIKDLATLGVPTDDKIITRIKRRKILLALLLRVIAHLQDEADKADEAAAAATSTTTNGTSELKRQDSMKKRRGSYHEYKTRSILMDMPTAVYDLALSFLSVRDLCQASSAAKSWHVNLCIAKVWQRVFQRCIGTRLPEPSQLGNGDLNDEWRRLVITEWQRYETALHTIAGAAQPQGSGAYIQEIGRLYHTTNNDWYILHVVFKSHYCVDKLALYVIDRYFTAARWSSWRASYDAMTNYERNESRNPQSLVTSSIAHGIRVFDALINVGGIYTSEVVKKCIRGAHWIPLQALLERDASIPIVDEMKTKPFDYAKMLQFYGNAWMRSPKQCRAMIRYVLDEFKPSGNTDPVQLYSSQKFAAKNVAMWNDLDMLRLVFVERESWKSWPVLYIENLIIHYINHADECCAHLHHILPFYPPSQRTDLLMRVARDMTVNQLRVWLDTPASPTMIIPCVNGGIPTGVAADVQPITIHVIDHIIFGDNYASGVRPNLYQHHGYAHHTADVKVPHHCNRPHHRQTEFINVVRVLIDTARAHAYDMEVAAAEEAAATAAAAAAAAAAPPPAAAADVPAAAAPIVEETKGEKTADEKKAATKAARIAAIVARRAAARAAAGAGAWGAASSQVYIVERPFDLSTPTPVYHDRYSRWSSHHHNGFTPLVHALHNKDTAIASGLMTLLMNEYKVDPSVKCSRATTTTTTDARSPLWYACSLPDTRVAHQLLDAGVTLSTPPVELLVATVSGHMDLVIHMLVTLLDKKSSWPNGGVGIAAAVCRAADDESTKEDLVLTERDKPLASDDELSSESEDDSDDDDDDDNAGEEKKKPKAKAAASPTLYRSSYRNDKYRQQAIRRQQREMTSQGAEQAQTSYATIARGREWIVPTDIMLAVIMGARPQMAAFWLSGARTIPPECISNGNGNGNNDGKEVKEAKIGWQASVANITFDATRYFPAHIIKRAIWRPLNEWQPINDGVKMTPQQQVDVTKARKQKYRHILPATSYGWSLPASPNMLDLCTTIAALIRDSGLSPDAADMWGRSLLWLAAWHPDCAPLVQHLLRLGADVDASGQVDVHGSDVAPYIAGVVSAARSGSGGVSSGGSIRTLCAYGANGKVAMASESLKRLSRALRTRQPNKERMKGITTVVLVQLLIDEQDEAPALSANDAIWSVPKDGKAVLPAAPANGNGKANGKGKSNGSKAKKASTAKAKQPAKKKAKKDASSDEDDEEKEKDGSDDDNDDDDDTEKSSKDDTSDDEEEEEEEDDDDSKTSKKRKTATKSSAKPKARAKAKSKSKTKSKSQRKAATKK